MPIKDPKKLAFIETKKGKLIKNNRFRSQWNRLRRENPVLLMIVYQRQSNNRERTLIFNRTVYQKDPSAKRTPAFGHQTKEVRFTVWGFQTRKGCLFSASLASIFLFFNFRSQRCIDHAYVRSGTTNISTLSSPSVWMVNGFISPHRWKTISPGFNAFSASNT